MTYKEIEIEHQRKRERILLDDLFDDRGKREIKLILENRLLKKYKSRWLDSLHRGKRTERKFGESNEEVGL